MCSKCQAASVSGFLMRCQWLATLLGSSLLQLMWSQSAVVTGVHHWLEVICSGFCSGTIELYDLSSYTLKVYFCKTDAKMLRPLPVKHLDSGSCHVREGYRSLVFTYHLEFPLRAITNATQIFSVVPLTQSPMDNLVHLILLSYCLGLFVYLRGREHWFSPIPQP